MNKKRLGLIKNNRREFLKKDCIATVAAPAVLSNSCQIKNNPDAGPVEFKSVFDQDYTNMPEDDEIFLWINDLWKIGDKRKYRFRMAGTEADHQSADFLDNKLSSIGIANVQKEASPIPSAFPEKRSPNVHEEALKQTAYPFIDLVRALDIVIKEKISNPKFQKT